jgi:hypothetical protein
MIVVILLLTASTGGAAAADSSAPAAPALSADSVLGSLNESIDWYRQARVTMREVNRTGALFAAEDQETARQALQRAFAAARARAALLKLTPDAATPKLTPAQQRLADARTGLEMGLKAEEQWVKRAPKAEREASRRRLELVRARLEIMKQMQGFNASLSGTAQTDLTQQIDTLEQSVPELRNTVAATEAASGPSAADRGSRTLGLVSRLIRLRESRMNVDDLSAATASLSRSVSAETRATGDELRSLGTRLSTLAENPESSAPEDGVPDRAGARKGAGRRARAAAPADVVAAALRR